VTARTIPSFMRGSRGNVVTGLEAYDEAGGKLPKALANALATVQGLEDAYSARRGEARQLEEAAASVKAEQSHVDRMAVLDADNPADVELGADLVAEHADRIKHARRRVEAIKGAHRVAVLNANAEAANAMTHWRKEWAKCLYTPSPSERLGDVEAKQARIRLMVSALATIVEGIELGNGASDGERTQLREMLNDDDVAPQLPTLAVVRDLNRRAKKVSGQEAAMRGAFGVTDGVHPPEGEDWSEAPDVLPLGADTDEEGDE